ncbi:MAG: hypothetical protein NTX50_03655 [Candidatus Sumerlaeota bacterium]|nr:hypothetical protein [Candidatus Sumerlaeota bacterium]
MQTNEQNLREALHLLLKRCPLLSKVVYWAGTSAIAIEELRHRQSLDLDFHTRKALLDVRPILAQIRSAFGKDFELVQPSDEFGSGFRGIISLPNSERVTIEVLSNYQDVSDEDLVPSTIEASILRVSLDKYLSDKIQCIAERNEARDLVDICAVLKRRPQMEALARRFVSEQDSLLMAERLLAWSDEEIVNDLEAYPDVNPADAGWARNTLLQWLKAERPMEYCDMNAPPRYIQSLGIAHCEVAPGRQVALAIAPGIFKHLACSELSEVLKKPNAARKYTLEALRCAPWNVLCEFDRDWLKDCLLQAHLPAPRRAALEFMLYD